MLLLLWSKVLIVFIESFGEERNTCLFFVSFFVCLIWFFLKIKCIYVEQKRGKIGNLRELIFFSLFLVFLP